MQTILGAGGDIGTLLAKELKSYTDRVRLVARQPKQVNGDDELFPADLTDATSVQQAVSGSEVVYLTVGLPYDHRVWEERWPVIMENVLKACLHEKCKLVFFDNVYAYDPLTVSDMKESNPTNPSSRKGKVRAALVQMIQKAGDQGLSFLIARSADFYGPGSKNGILNVLVTDNIAKGSKPNWQSDPDKIHSFTFVPDAARAVAKLGNTPEAYQQIWHLPTSREKLTGRQLIGIATRLAGKKNTWFTLSPWMMKLGGFFSKTVGELYEMQYQNDRDYFFNSEKFEKAFGVTPTSYEEGIKQTLQHTASLK